MFKSLVILTCLAYAFAFSEFESEVQVVIDPEGNDFYLVPIELLDKVRTKRQNGNSTEMENTRSKRQSANTTASITSEGSFVKHEQNLFDNKNYRVDGKLVSQRAQNGDMSHLGQIDFNYKPLDSRFTVTGSTEGIQAIGSSKLYENKAYRVDASGFLQKTSPDNILVQGGQLDLTHKRTDSSVGISIKNAQGFGSRLETTGSWNIFKTADGRGSIELTGSYGRNLGGPSGSRSRNCGALLHGQYNF